MPTHNDETLHDRYTRDHLTHLARLATMTPDQIAAMELDLHNAIAEVGRLRVQLPSQGGEAVEVVAYGDKQQLSALKNECSASCAVWNAPGRNREPLMTVDQHNRIVADVRANRDAVLKVMRAKEMLPKCEDATPAGSRVVPVELLEVCVKRWSILANEFITGSPSYEEEQLQIGKLRALLEVKP